MLDPVTVTVCETCRAPDRAEGGGVALSTALRSLARAHPRVAVAPFACLWSCGAGASVQISGAGRPTYVLGHFAVADAPAILDFATAYAAAPDGEVPFDTWPAGVLGHFLARVPVRR